MPRFTSTEKENIRRLLISKGEVLFLSLGLQKVTIDDLVRAVSIARASFYGFYESKESLFLDIAQTRQQEMFASLTALLESNASLPNKERVRQVFASTQDALAQYPILRRIDASTMAQISRKASAEQLAMYVAQNMDAAMLLQQHGIQFRCDTATASLAFQAIYHSWAFLQEQGAAHTEAVTGILLEGVIQQIIV